MIFHGNCLEVLKDFEQDLVDAIITDPPYGLSFMNKHWDYDIPAVEIWKECLRVLKPGGHALIACGTRTQHRMTVNIEDAGFEIRDVVTWLYGSGFPKSHNLKDKWEGFGTALKPACEFWTLARKPLSESTVAKNVLRWGTGAINIDGCRVETSDKLNGSGTPPLKYGLQNSRPFHSKAEPRGCNQSPLGRWPANLILGCCGNDPHDPDCAALILDQQSGELKTGAMKPTLTSTMGYGGSKGWITQSHASSGGASRFFYCAKASKSERNSGLEHEQKEKQGARPNSKDASGKFPDHDHRTTGGNNHPTVKPLKLMSYLCRLITPPSGIVLDPFMGSGSTGVAAKLEGFKFIGMEREKEYLDISEKRMAL